MYIQSWLKIGKCVDSYLIVKAQSNWNWEKATKIEAEQCSDVLRIDVSEKIRKTVDVTLMKTRDLLGL